MNFDNRFSPQAGRSSLAGQSGDDHLGRGGLPRDPDRQDLQRFEQALQPGGADSPSQMAANHFVAPSPGPVVLPSREAPSGSTVSHGLWGDALNAAARLMVGEQSGRKQVRVDIDEEVLPGVTLVIEESEGRLEVEFTCANEESRLRLNDALGWQASELARRLARDVLMRTQTDDPDDLHVFEVAASP